MVNTKIDSDFVKFITVSVGDVLLYTYALRLRYEGVFYGRSIRFSRDWQTTGVG